MSDIYTIHNAAELCSPSLLIFRELVEHNLAETVRIAGNPQRLRPHCKTHKTREIVHMQIEMGITAHKCATIAEARMLAESGVNDVLIAYQMVGPNLKRLANLVDQFPDVRFGTLVDCPLALTQLSKAIGSTRTVDVLLDLNPGMNRTGILPGPEAIELYEMLASMPGLEPGGLHWYDGQHRQADVDERRGCVLANWNQLTRFRNQLQMTGLPVPRVVAGGTGSFSILAEVGEPGIQLSPGTTSLYDTGYGQLFTDLNFKPALGILTRVISKTGGRRVTLDVGHKACAADPPQGQRLTFPTVPDAQEIIHSEEHLVIETDLCDQLQIGDALVALPRHVCPASAVHPFAHIVVDGMATERWAIAARDREPLEF